MPTTTTTTLTLGAVVLGSPFPGVTPGPGEEIVGAPPQWSDESDATYAHLIVSVSSGGLAWTQAEPVDADLISYTVRLRAKAAPFASPDAVVKVWFGRNSDVWETFGDGLVFPADGVIHEVAVDGFGFGAGSPLPEGANVEVGLNTGDEVWVYEVEIVATIPDVAERATRLFPRDDALGLGSAPRIHPPPKRGRVVGGYT